jgi:hypothetical protein
MRTTANPYRIVVKNLTPRPPSLRGKGVNWGSASVAAANRVGWVHVTLRVYRLGSSLSAPPPSLRGKGDGGLGFFKRFTPLTALRYHSITPAF